MTVIVGLVDKESKMMYMGSDTLLSGETEKVSSTHEKIYKKGQYLVGHTGSPRAMQVVRYSTALPRYSRKSDATSFMVNRMVPRLMVDLSEQGYARNDAGRIHIEDIFLMMFNGRIFSIWSDFQVFEPTHDFFAVGSGSQTALGALMSSADLEPEERVYSAIEAAMEFTTNVGGSIKMLKKEY